ncbi:MAG: SDR family NAD(P)-dependent oxidoreductase [Ilumatobacter sp.]
MKKRVMFVWHGAVAAIKQPAPAHWTVAGPVAGCEFDGQVVVVAGAGGIIGRELVDAFASEGAFVHALDSDREALDAAEIVRQGKGWAGQVRNHQLDVTNEDAVTRFAQECVSVDVLVVATVLNDRRRQMSEMSSSTLQHMLDINVVAPANLVFALSESLERTGSGSVVFLTSVHASRASRWPQYGTAKGALRKLTIDLAGVLAERGVRVNAVAPGWTADSTAPPDDRSAPPHPLGAAIVPIEAVVQAVVFLADRRRSPMTTGQELVVDGGALLSPPR